MSFFFFLTETGRVHGVWRENPRAPVTIMLLTGAIFEVNLGLPLRANIHTHSHNEIFDLTQGSVKKKKILWCHNLSRLCACFFFLLAGITLFLLLKRIHMDQKGWLFNVAISAFAVLCHAAFSAHCSVSADGWHPYNQSLILWGCFSSLSPVHEGTRLNLENKTNDELLLGVFVTKSDSVYVHPESVVLKPAWVQMKEWYRSGKHFFPLS